VILCDTGPIVASALDGDDHHHACVDLFTGLHLAGRRLLVPGTVVAEVGYLLAREAGARVEALFLTALADGDFIPVDLTADDYRRAAQLVVTYADPPLGATDATVVALAQRWGIVENAERAGPTPFHSGPAPARPRPCTPPLPPGVEVVRAPVRVPLVDCCRPGPRRSAQIHPTRLQENIIGDNSRHDESEGQHHSMSRTVMICAIGGCPWRRRPVRGTPCRRPMSGAEQLPCGG